MLASDNDAWARRAAAWALGELAQPKVPDALQVAVNDGDFTVKQNVQNAIERLSFLKEQSKDGQLSLVDQGIWIISGSSLTQVDRLDRAIELKRKAPASERREKLAQLSTHGSA